MKHDACYACGCPMIDLEGAPEEMMTPYGVRLALNGSTPEGYTALLVCEACTEAYLAWAQAKLGQEPPPQARA
jgi:hypothetical protein